MSIKVANPCFLSSFNNGSTFNLFLFFVFPLFCHHFLIVPCDRQTIPLLRCCTTGRLLVTYTSYTLVRITAICRMFMTCVNEATRGPARGRHTCRSIDLNIYFVLISLYFYFVAYINSWLRLTMIYTTIKKKFPKWNAIGELIWCLPASLYRFSSALMVKDDQRFVNSEYFHTPQ